MLRELAEAFEAITAEAPLVLRLEDLHWSDYSTLELLGFIARRQDSARLLVLATYRPVEVILREHPLKNLKQELQVHGQCKELPLALLSESAVTDYLNSRFSSLFGSLSNATPGGKGPPPQLLRELAHTIYQRTDGNPLFMVNVVDYLTQPEIVKTVGDAVTAPSVDAVDEVDIPPNIVEMIERNLIGKRIAEWLLIRDELMKVDGKNGSTATSRLCWRRRAWPAPSFLQQRSPQRWIGH